MGVTNSECHDSPFLMGCSPGSWLKENINGLHIESWQCQEFPLGWGPWDVKDAKHKVPSAPKKKHREVLPKSGVKVREIACLT